MASEIQDVFVEIILSDKDQKELSKDLFKDENYSDSDCLDNVKEFKSSNTCTGCHYFLSGSCALENSSDDFVDGACEDYETLKTLKGNSAKELYLNRDMSDFEMDMYM